MMSVKPVMVSSDEAAGRAQVFDWGTITWLVDRKTAGSNNLSLARVTIRHGNQNPHHAHDRGDEVLHLLSGSLVHRAGDQNVELGPGDTLLIPAGTPHSARCRGKDDAVMIVAYPTGSRDYRPRIDESSTRSKTNGLELRE